MVEQISKRLHITPQAVQKVAVSIVGIVAITITITMVTIANIYFVGDGVHNYFTEEFLSKDYWDFNLDNPYEN